MERKYETLTLESIFPFGKYKGQPLGDVIVGDPGYLIWLRSERWKTEQQKNPGASLGDVGLSMDIHILLDDVTRTNKRFRSYRLRYEGGPPIDFADNGPVVERVSEESWGAW